MDNVEIVVENMVYTVETDKLGTLHLFLNHLSDDKEIRQVLHNEDDQMPNYSDEVYSILHENGIDPNSGVAEIIAKYVNTNLLADMGNFFPEYDSDTDSFIIDSGGAPLTGIGISKFELRGQGFSANEIDDTWFEDVEFILDDDIKSAETKALIDCISCELGIDYIFEYFVSEGLSIIDLDQTKEMCMTQATRKWRQKCEDAREQLRKHILRTIMTASLNTAELDEATRIIIDHQLSCYEDSVR